MKKLLTSFALVLCLAATSFFAVACGGEKVSVESVSLNKNTLTLTAGQSETLVATITPNNATNKNVTWTTTAAAVATVNGGTVNAVAAGTAIITVKTADGDKAASCIVTVNPAPAQTDITEADWKAAMQKVDTLKNGTLSINHENFRAVYYKGELVNEDTDLTEFGSNVTFDIFMEEMVQSVLGMPENPTETTETTTVKMDIDNKKLSITTGESETLSVSEYRVEGNNICVYETDPHFEDDAFVGVINTKEIYGPYPDEETATSLLSLLRELDITEAELTFEDETVSTPENAYSHFIPTDATTFFGKVTYDSYALNVTIKFDANKNIVSATATQEETVPFFKAFPTEAPEELETMLKDFSYVETNKYTYTLSNVGTTTLSDEAIETFTPDRTEHRYVLSTEQQFESLFEGFDLEHGIIIQTSDEESVSIKKIGNNYHALLETRAYDEDTREWYTDEYKYFITSADGIAVYEGNVTHHDYRDFFNSWNAPQTQNLAVAGDELASLLTLLPEEVSQYLDTYNGGKKLSELFSAFHFDPKYMSSYGLNELSATLTSDSTHAPATVMLDYWAQTEDDVLQGFWLSSVSFGDSSFRVEGIGQYDDFEQNSPLKEGEYAALFDTQQKSFFIQKNIEEDGSLISSVQVYYSEDQKALSIHEMGQFDGTQTFFYVEGNDLISVSWDSQMQFTTHRDSFASADLALAALKAKLESVIDEKGLGTNDITDFEFDVNGTTKTLSQMYYDLAWEDASYAAPDGRNGSRQEVSITGDFADLFPGEHTIGIMIRNGAISRFEFHPYPDDQGTLHWAIEFDEESVSMEIESVRELLSNYEVEIP